MPQYVPFCHFDEIKRQVHGWLYWIDVLKSKKTLDSYS